MMDNSDVEMKEAAEQSQDTNNVVLHPQNGSVDVQPPYNDDKLNHSATGQDTKPAELEKQENLDGVPPESEATMDAEKNTESELEYSNCKETVNGLETMTENVDQDLQLGEKTEGQKIKENSELEKTPAEIGAAPAELVVEKASHYETRVEEVIEKKNEFSDEVVNEKQDEPSNEVANEKKDEPSNEVVNEKKDEPSNEVVSEKKDEPLDEEVLATENEGSVNELKQPEKMVAPTPSLEDGDTEKAQFPKAEREGNDAAWSSVEAMVDARKDLVKGDVFATATAGINANLGTALDDQNPTTPPSMVKCPSTKSGGQNEEFYRNTFNEVKMPGDEDGTPEEQAAFIRELESFYRKRATDFKAPRFYGQQLNCLKLWRLVIRLGGYDRVTGSKLWRQVGESFHPPKTCTTISWTFRIFYEKALLEYERHVTEGGGLQLPLFALSDPSAVDNELLQGSTVQASGSGRARRDSAVRSMQGWHSRLLGNCEGGEQMMKDKNGNIVVKREKSIKSIGGSLKQNRPDEVEYPVKAARIEPSKQLVTSVVDVGPPADWVRINIRETKDCYEVYALVPGLLREEVRVQSDPAGRLVITGQPDQPDNPWGITAFKKVVSLPGRIDPLHTSAVVSLHGRLFVRVPFEQ